VGALDRHHVERLLDDEDAVLSRFIGAQRAGIDVGCVEADGTQGDPLLHFENRLGEADRVILRRLQDMVGEPGGRFWPDARQARELVDEPADRLGGDTADVGCSRHGVRFLVRMRAVGADMT
jgi:hypothetical protein